MKGRRRNALFPSIGEAAQRDSSLVNERYGLIATVIPSVPRKRSESLVSLLAPEG